MRREQLHCVGCCSTSHATTEHLMIGFIPEDILEESVDHAWVKAAVCANCGTIHPMEITEAQLNQAEKRYLNALVETDNMDPQEARILLGME